jgi:hypothetical protein
MNQQTPRPGSSFGLNPTDELNDLRMSAEAMPLLEHVKRFIKDTVNPMSEEFHRLGEGRADRYINDVAKRSVCRKKICGDRSGNDSRLDRLQGGD